MDHKLIKQYVSSYVFQPKPDVFVVFSSQPIVILQKMFDLAARKYL